MARPASLPAPPGTREKLVDAAVTLMRRSGLSGAGINEIVRESGAPKGSVYHFFPGGKREIVEAGLAVHAGRVAAFIDATLSDRRSPREKVKALFEAFARRLEEGEFRHSCAAGTVCLDLDEEFEALLPAVAGALQAYQRAIAAHFPFRSRRRAESFAGLLLTAIEGAYIRGRAERSGRAFREAGEWLAGLAVD
mgnify:CR=1 FL=1